MALIFMKQSEQYFKSMDSLGSVILRDNSFRNRVNEKNESTPKMKQCNSISKALMSAVSGNKKNQNIAKRPTMVKASALLYEITDRTNQLAQPRIRLNSDEKNSQKTEIKNNRIPEASPRVIELSRPRMIFKPISKLNCNVSPKALTAIATQRIIELSKPRKIRYSELPKNRKRKPHTPCSARLEFLAKPRLFPRKMKLTSDKGKKSLQKKFERKNCLREPRYNTNSKSCKKYKKLGRQNKKRKRFVEASGSSRSLIIVSSFEQCNHSPESRGRRCKKMTKRKLTSVKRYIKKNPSTTLSNSDHSVSLKRCEGESIFIPTSGYFNNYK